MGTLNTDFILNEWVPALLSGEYEQGTNFLHSGDAFCCLGVACDLLIKKGILPEWKLHGHYDPEADKFYHVYEGKPDSNFLRPVYATEGQIRLMPDSVLEYIGLSGYPDEPLKAGLLVNVGLLARLNDTHTSFRIIAEHIKYEVENP